MTSTEEDWRGADDDVDDEEEALAFGWVPD